MLKHKTADLKSLPSNGFCSKNYTLNLTCPDLFMGNALITMGTNILYLVARVDSSAVHTHYLQVVILHLELIKILEYLSG